MLIIWRHSIELIRHGTAINDMPQFYSRALQARVGLEKLRLPGHFNDARQDHNDLNQ